MADQGEDEEVPTKRIKLCENSDDTDKKSKLNPSKDNNTTDGLNKRDDSVENSEKTSQNNDKQNEKYFPVHTKAEDVAITEYVSKHKGFHGVLKQRFVDFLVNERDIKGNLVQLTHTNIPPLEESTESNDVLTKDDIDNIQSVSDSKEKSFFVTLTPDDDKDHRTLVHKAVKRMFPHLDTETVTVDGHKAVKVYRYHGNPAKKRTDKWPSNRGNFCKFVLHKENKDTMEAICLLAKLVHVKTNCFSYAGTKDRRGVTSQEVRAYRVQAQRLKGLNKTLKGMVLGNFEYVQDRLTLGQLSGNHFVITLRDVQGDEAEIEQAMSSIRDVGFINYYGLQRFGTAVVPTHHIGRALLLSKWSDAVHAILSPKTGKEHEFNDALQLWRDSGDAAQALKILSRHKCIENTLLQGLVKHGNKDLVNALQWIPRNTRLMYIHAYQSYIWNNAVSWRIKKYGLLPVEGDLVLSNTDSSNTDASSQEECVGEACEAMDTDDETPSTSKNTSVHILTSDDVASGTFTIHDVVMPLPGYDVIYPGYGAKQFYKELMDKDGIDIDNLRHRVKDYSLSGGYRRLLIKPSFTSWHFLHYNDINEPLVLTDRDRYEGKTSLDIPSEGKFLALQIELTLPPSCYATMAIREIMKCETASSHQASLNRV